MRNKKGKIAALEAATEVQRRCGEATEVQSPGADRKQHHTNSRRLVPYKIRKMDL